MILFITITFLLICINGLSEAICDVLQHKYDQSVFNSSKFKEQFWNPSLSWMNKHVDGSKFKKLLFKTVLVFTTDAWHLFKTIKTISEYSIIILVITYINVNFWMILILISFKILMKLFFEFFYSKILIKQH